MSTQVDKAQRILKVQRRLHEIEQWKLNGLQQHLAELEQAQADLLRGFNEDNALQGLFVDVMARRLKRLAEEADRVQTEIQVQAGRALEQGARAVCAEGLCEKVEGQEAREAGKRQLLDIIERCIGETVSLPQDCQEIVHTSVKSRARPDRP